MSMVMYAVNYKIDLHICIHLHLCIHIKAGNTSKPILDLHDFKLIFNRLRFEKLVATPLTSKKKKVSNTPGEMEASHSIQH